MDRKYHEYGHTLLRLALGIMFIIAGFNKFSNPDGPIGMLTGLGFPAPTFFAWLLLLSEIVFGALVLIGWKVKYTVWPLVIVLAVAAFTVVIPNLSKSGPIILMFHLLGIAALISLALTCPGKIAVSKE